MNGSSAAAGRADQPRPLRLAWTLFVAVLVAVHVVYPAARPIHPDTMMTGGKVLLPWGEILGDTRRNAFEPAFYFAMKAWCDVAGVSLRALLAPAALCAVATPCVLAWALRPWIADARTRLLAAALAGLHIAAVLFGSGLAKPYAALSLLAAFAAGAWIRAVETELTRRPDDAERSRSASRWFAAFAVASVAASQLHFPGLLIPLVAAVHGAIVARREMRLRRAAVWAIVTLAAAAALVLVWHGRIETRLVEGQGMHWIERARGGSLVRAIATDLQTFVWGVPLPNLAAPSVAESAGAVAAIAAAVVGLPWLAGSGTRRAGPRAALLAAALVVPFAGVALADFVRPIYYARYVAVALLPAAVLGALAVESLLRSHRAAAATCLAALLLAGRAGGFALLGFAMVGDSPGLRLLGAMDLARAERATLVVVPHGRVDATWMRWIDAALGPRPPDVAVAWSDDRPADGASPDAEAPQGVALDGSLAQLLRGHRRVVVATADLADVGALRGALDGWRVESASWTGTSFDAATGRRRPSLPLAVLVPADAPPR
jgi:hypothetical protein